MHKFHLLHQRCASQTAAPRNPAQYLVGLGIDRTPLQWRDCVTPKALDGRPSLSTSRYPITILLTPSTAIRSGVQISFKRLIANCDNGILPTTVRLHLTVAALDRETIDRGGSQISPVIAAPQKTAARQQKCRRFIREQSIPLQPAL